MSNPNMMRHMNEEGFVFGKLQKVERPPTPMEKIMGMYYADEGRKENLESYNNHMEEKKRMTQFLHSPPTKASLGHAQGSAEKRRLRDEALNEFEEPKFVLSKFKNVKPKLKLPPL